MVVIKPLVSAEAYELISLAIRDLFPDGPHFDAGEEDQSMRDLLCECAEDIIELLENMDWAERIGPDIDPYLQAYIHDVGIGNLDPFAPSPIKIQPIQAELFNTQNDTQTPAERALIDQLIAATKLYDSSEAIQELFAFTIRLREFAPFNAMLLHIQKPGLTHAATAHDW